MHVQPSRSGERVPVMMRRWQQQHAPHSHICCGNTGNTCEHEQERAPHTHISVTAASPMENTFYREHIRTAAATAARQAHPGAPEAPYLRAPYVRAVAAEEASFGTAAVAAAVATAEAVSQMRHMPGYTSHLKRRCAQVDAHKFFFETLFFGGKHRRCARVDAVACSKVLCTYIDFVDAHQKAPYLRAPYVLI